MDKLMQWHESSGNIKMTEDVIYHTGYYLDICK